MNQDQVMGLLRQILPVIGGIGVTLGWFTADQVSAWTQHIFAFASPVLIIVGLVWSVFANKPTSVAASIGANPSTTVKPAADGSAVVTIKDPEMAQAALQADRSATV